MPYVYFVVIVPSFYYLSNRTDVQCSAVSHLWFLCFNHLILSSIKLKKQSFGCDFWLSHGHFAEK